MFNSGTAPVPPDLHRSGTAPPSRQVPMPPVYPLPRNDGGSWSVSPDGTVTIELWINGKRWRPCGY